MSSVGVVTEARGWAKEMIAREAKGPGDFENAMRRIETRFGVPYGLLWSLRYRHGLKDILASSYVRLKIAYEAQCAQQIRKLEHELEITKAKAGADHAAVRAAEALVAEEG